MAYGLSSVPPLTDSHLLDSEKQLDDHIDVEMGGISGDGLDYHDAGSCLFQCSHRLLICL
jgi:hypothetical protein